MNYSVKKKHPFNISLKVPPDKSISHRALIIGSLSKKEIFIENLLESKDILSTVKILRKLGKKIEKKKNFWVIKKGDFSEPDDVLDAGNSGTTARLILGVLSHLPFFSVITGDNSLRKRPMERVIRPLSLMGGEFLAREGKFLPIVIKGKKLNPIHYKLPIPSAQVKSAIILASLSVPEVSIIEEEIPSRDHTERMIEYMGGDIERKGKSIFVSGKKNLESRNFYIPGDISSAAFFITLSSLIKGSSIIVEDVGLNPTRIDFLEILKKMGVKVKIDSKKQKWEPTGNVEVKYGKLSPIFIKRKNIPSIIDEIPLIALLATQANGESKILGAEELRVKESDRIHNTVENLKLMGANIEELSDGMVIKGPTKLKGNKVNSEGDHRMAMMLSIAGSVADGETLVENAECVNISFPQFFKILERI